MAEILINSAAEDEVYLNGATAVGAEIRYSDVFKNGKLITYNLEPEAAAFIQRVIADGGTVEQSVFLNNFIIHAKANNYYDDIVAAYSPSWGVKGTTTASKLYSIIGAGQDIEQAVGAEQPAITLAGENGRTILTCDGANHNIGGLFVYASPQTVVSMGFRQKTWTINDIFHDGGNNVSMAVKQSAVTPDIKQQQGGSVGSADSGLVVNAAAHLRARFGAVDCCVQVDGNAETTSAFAGSANSAGFTIGAKADGTQPSNITGGAWICLNSPEDANYDAKMAAIRAFDVSAYGTPA